MGDPLVEVDDFNLTNPAHVEGLSYRRGTVTIHLASGNRQYVWKGYDDADAAKAIAEVRRVLWPSGAD